NAAGAAIQPRPINGRVRPLPVIPEEPANLPKTGRSRPRVMLIESPRRCVTATATDCQGEHRGEFEIRHTLAARRDAASSVSVSSAVSYRTVCRSPNVARLGTWG